MSYPYYQAANVANRDVSFANTNVEKAEWAAWLGKPPVNMPISPYDATNQATWQVQEGLRGESAFLGNTMTLLAFANNSVVTSLIFPIVVDDTNLQVHWSHWDFQPHLPDIVPELGIQRLVTSQRTQHRQSMIRYGIGVQLEYGFMETELGREHYKLNLAQINMAFNEGLNYQGLEAIVYNGDIFRRVADRYNIAVGDYYFEDIMNRELHFWAVFQREANPMAGLSNALNNINREYNDNVKLDWYAVPKEVLDYLELIPIERNNYYISGEKPPKSDPVDTDSGAYTDAGGNKFIVLRSYAVNQDGPINPFEQEAQIGEYFVCTCPFAGQDYTGYTSNHRTIEIYSEDSDSWESITLRTMLDSCMRFNEKGEIIQAINTNPNHLRGGTVTFSPEDYLVDMFYYADKDKRMRTVGVFGDIHTFHLPISAYQDMANSFIAMLGRTGLEKSQIHSTISRARNLIIYLNKDIRYDDALNDFLLEIATNAKDKDIKPIDYKGIGLVWEPGFAGAFDLPESPAPGQVYSWHNLMRLPPTHLSKEGWESIANTYNRLKKTFNEKTGFSNDAAKTVSETMELFSSIFRHIEMVYPGSLDPITGEHDLFNKFIEYIIDGPLSPLFLSDIALLPSNKLDGLTANQITAGENAASDYLRGQFANGTGDQRALVQQANEGLGIEAGPAAANGAGVLAQMLELASPAQRFEAQRRARGGAFGPGDAGRRAPGGTPIDNTVIRSAAVEELDEFSTIRSIVQSLFPDSRTIDADALANALRGARQPQSIGAVFRYGGSNVPNPNADEEHALPNLVNGVNVYTHVDEDNNAVVYPVNQVWVPSSKENAKYWLGLVLRPELDDDNFTNEANFRAYLVSLGLRALVLITLQAVKDSVWTAAGNYQGSDAEKIVNAVKVALGKSHETNNYMLDSKQNTNTNPLTYFADKMLTFFAENNGLLDTNLLEQIYQVQNVRTRRAVENSKELYDYLMGVDFSRSNSSLVKASYANNYLRTNLVFTQGMLNSYKDFSALATVPQASTSAIPIPITPAQYGKSSTGAFPSAGASGKHFKKPTQRVQSKFIGATMAHLDLSGVSSYIENFMKAREAKGMPKSGSLYFPKGFQKRDVPKPRSPPGATNMYRYNMEALKKKRMSPLNFMIAVAFMNTPVNKDSFEAFITENVMFPANFLILRPHERYNTMMLSYLKPGKETGTTRLGRVRVVLGEDTHVGFYSMRLNYYSATIVTAPKNILNVRNCLVTGYTGGCGHIPYTSTDGYNPGQGHYGKKGESLFIMMTAWAEKNYPKPYYTAGRKPTEQKFSGDSYEGIEGRAKMLSCSSAAWYSTTWDWGSMNSEVSNLAIARGGIDESYEAVAGNSICFPGEYRKYDMRGNKETKMPGGHWSHSMTYPNCHAARIATAPVDRHAHQYTVSAN